MTTAERFGVATTEAEQSSALPLATLAAVASVLLIYVSSTFQIADIFGVKRLAQVLLIVPIGAVAAYFLVSRPARLVDPLIFFLLLKLGTEIVLRGARPSYVLDSVSAMLALTVVACVPAKSVDAAGKTLVTLSGAFALMAIIQTAMLAYDPQLLNYVLEPVDDGETQDYIRHPIALLALSLQRESTPISLFGMSVGRMQSFAKEPSLNVLYFMLPASLAFMRRSTAWGCVMFAYCVLSMSGSVLLACGFAGFWWLVSRVTSMKRIIPHAMLTVMLAYLLALQFSSMSLLTMFDSLSQYGDVLNKGKSLTSRTSGALVNADAAATAPFGGVASADLPGPWLVSSSLTAGWLGALCLVWFLFRLGRQFENFYARSPAFSAQRVGCILFSGALATILVFNDYQMGNYAGLLMMGVIYRTLHLANLQRQL